MALDISARKVYWLDPFEFTLHRAGYDGEDNEERGVKRATPKADGTFDIVTIDSLPVASQIQLYEKRPTLNPSKESEKCDEKTQFMCKHTEICIDIGKVCDGRWDCYDGSDEDIRGICDRVQNCVNGTFACAPTKQCLPNSWRCDGRVDCPDRSDEKNCEPRDCDADHFQCLTGQCIPLQWVCDGRANCRDGSDELHCYEGCRVGREFRCDPSSACLDMSLKCDGVVDCENGFDEKDCANISSTRFCRKINEYLCRREQRCIRRSAVCDGIEDCVDGQDEQKCHGKKCALGLFTCRNGEQCIAGHLECDGVADCDDASDEHEHCCGSIYFLGYF
ncbi:Low-density lipoprotein receptor domain class A [Teladorsagia circumcincta]|uniref:Low-density lipoprotein receptor domain class A n=1 Tax=Teladorsagia circumcincta TaxID=45464 RepID=A0A2G9UG10_TELCI|nr:Low-density lipoprotein receptor domain class A [Teladorsagia circumcincta]